MTRGHPLKSGVHDAGWKAGADRLRGLYEAGQPDTLREFAREWSVVGLVIFPNHHESSNSQIDSCLLGRWNGLWYNKEPPHWILELHDNVEEASQLMPTRQWLSSF